ncbi:hypothetical protein [Paenibacillus phocaensis]|uniref:hypothetical protein n=1 Tax=Paenibacillus phocaensis TaxID=1776378 RepID=UPI000839D573|nr:hypothetical protein [Paenibacillus phocaensis]
MLIRKYLITLLIVAATIGYTVCVDMLMGLPWNNFIINWNYSLTDPAERIFAYILVLFLGVPDLLHFVSRKRKESGKPSGNRPSLHGASLASSAGKEDPSSSEDSSSGLTARAASVNQGSDNQSSGQNNVK